MNSTLSIVDADAILSIPVTLPATRVAGGLFLHATIIHIAAGQELQLASLDIACFQTPAPAVKLDAARPLVLIGLFQGSAVTLERPPGEPLMLAQIEYAGDHTKLLPMYFEPISGPQTVTLSVYSNCVGNCVIAATAGFKLHT